MASTLVGRRPLPRARFERALGNIADIPGLTVTPTLALGSEQGAVALDLALDAKKPTLGLGFTTRRSEEHTSELQSLMRISYAVFCLNKKKYTIKYTLHTCKQKTNSH